MQRSPAMRKSWKNIRFSNPKNINTNILISKELFEIVKQGLIPEAMEDKWFLYYVRGIIHFCRSWTGYEIYRAKIQANAEGYLIKTLQVETNQKKYHCGSDEEEIARFIGLFENVLFPFHTLSLGPGERRVLELTVSSPEIFST